MSGAPRIGGSMSLVKQLRRFGRRFDDCASLRAELEHLRGENDKHIAKHNALVDKLVTTERELERLQGRIDKLLASPRRCDDCPGGDDYKTEVERLREENKRVGDYLAGALDERDRLHRIEEAAREYLNDDQQGADRSALRAALGEEA